MAEDDIYLKAAELRNALYRTMAFGCSRKQNIINTTQNINKN